MASIKLTYIDKDSWDEEKNLFYLRNDLTVNTTHEFVSYSNIVNLETNLKYTTMCTKKNLESSIKKNMSAEYSSIALVDFDLELEYIFSVLIDIAKEYNIDIYLLNKSKYPIRNNVSMTIDLDEYDTTTDFEVVKDILVSNLKDSLENARKSKKPQHATDIGVTLEEESKGFLDLIMSNLGLDGYIEYLEDDEEMGDEEIDAQIDQWLTELEKKEVKEKEQFKDKLSCGIDSNLDIRKTYDDMFKISNEKSSISFDKDTAKKMIRILEVLIDE